MQFISHGQFSSLKASFEIKLGPLDFNKYFGTLIFLDIVSMLGFIFFGSKLVFIRLLVY